MDDKLLAAQAFLFFGAGFETSASATSYTLHMFAQHQEAQERARAEVLATLARHNGVITYEAVKEMTYLTWALKESMRLVPPVGNVNRKVLRSCYLPGVGQLDPGIRILVSACAFHRDPRYFPEPDEFRPERFNPDNLTPGAKLAYIPFGVGPRACIGEQMAMLVSVSGLAAVLAGARVAPARGLAPAPPPALAPGAVGGRRITACLPCLTRSKNLNNNVEPGSSMKGGVVLSPYK
ncbi:cytochrome P450 6a2-like [Choristoneura fumiferana]|uniref:cytochrome P450 6a2-like n=1 Tax=Choristoneura fumiferana TaxID=7141 RepID=UPI003D15CA5D